jgi:hypothetical protein
MQENGPFAGAGRGFFDFGGGSGGLLSILLEIFSNKSAAANPKTKRTTVVISPFHIWDGTSSPERALLIIAAPSGNPHIPSAIPQTATSPRTNKPALSKGCNVATLIAFSFSDYAGPILHGKTPFSREFFLSLKLFVYAIFTPVPQRFALATGQASIVYAI